MCGIAGVARQAGNLTLDQISSAKEMGECLLHRGPDAYGFFEDSQVALAHRRLAILDITVAGAQPMTSASGRFVISYNGEIYNFRELSKRLHARGWANRSNSDTEVILAFIERWGIRSFLDEADGMFAIALYDKIGRRVHLIRDAFGEKPLFYLQRGDDIYFASESTTIEANLHHSLSICPEAVRQFFTFGYLRGTNSIFTGIKKVAPGTWLNFDLKSSGHPEATRYWLPQLAKPAKWEASPGKFLELFETSARNRTISDRPLGAFLSGGIDSALTSTVAARHVRGSLKTFTMTWEDREMDESINARKVASALGTDHHEVRLSSADVLGEVRQLGQHMDEPNGLATLLASRLVAKAARQHVVVILSGDGGDELLAGYNRHRWLLKVAALQTRSTKRLRATSAYLLRNASPLLAIALAPISPKGRPRKIANKAQKLAMAIAESDIANSYETLLQRIPSHDEKSGLDPSIQRALCSKDRDEVLWGLRVADMTGYLPDHILATADCATMSVSLESRSAFLNRGLAEWALQQPADELLESSISKLPARQALANLLPGVSFSQSKVGFGIPTAEFLRDHLLDDLNDALSTFKRRQVGIEFDWESEISNLVEGRLTNDGGLLWSLLMFEYWQHDRRRYKP